MTGFSTFAALLPELRAAWGLSNTEAGWIGGIVFAGYMLAVPILVPLTDRVDARKVYAAGLVVTIASLVGFAALADGFGSAMLWRAAFGVGLAGTYMPGLRILSDRFTGPKQSRAISFYTATFAIGVSVSYVLADAAATVGWRAAFAVSALGPVVAGVAVAGATRGPAPHVTRPTTALLDFRPVLKTRAAMAFVLAYAGHCWELFALRAWIVAFLAFAAAQRPDGLLLTAAGWAALIGLSGLPASVLGNELAVRFGRGRVIAGIMALSVLTAAVVGLSATWPLAAVIALALAYNVLVTGDSASITAGAVAAAPDGYRGATMAVHATIGFAGAMLGPLAMGLTLDAAGGESVGAWWAAFAACGAGSALGLIAFAALRRQWA